MSDTTPKLTEPALRALAVSDPHALVYCIQNTTLSPGLMSRAAEAMGLVRDHSIAIPVLLDLLRHDETVVQEAAIYGLSSHMNDDVRRQLEILATSTNTHPLIREIAQDALEV